MIGQSITRHLLLFSGFFCISTLVDGTTTPLPAHTEEGTILSSITKETIPLLEEEETHSFFEFLYTPLSSLSYLLFTIVIGLAYLSINLIKEKWQPSNSTLWILRVACLFFTTYTTYLRILNTDAAPYSFRAILPILLIWLSIPIHFFYTFIQDDQNGNCPEILKISIETAAALVYNPNESSDISSSYEILLAGHLILALFLLALPSKKKGKGQEELPQTLDSKKALLLSKRTIEKNKEIEQEETKKDVGKLKSNFFTTVSIGQKRYLALTMMLVCSIFIPIICINLMLNNLRIPSIESKKKEICLPIGFIAMGLLHFLPSLLRIDSCQLGWIGYLLLMPHLLTVITCGIYMSSNNSLKIPELQKNIWVTSALGMHCLSTLILILYPTHGESNELITIPSHTSKESLSMISTAILYLIGTNALDEQEIPATAHLCILIALILGAYNLSAFFYRNGVSGITYFSILPYIIVFIAHGFSCIYSILTMYGMEPYFFTETSVAFNALSAWIGFTHFILPFLLAHLTNKEKEVQGSTPKQGTIIARTRKELQPFSNGKEVP